MKTNMTKADFQKENAELRHMLRAHTIWLHDTVNGKKVTRWSAKVEQQENAGSIEAYRLELVSSLASHGGVCLLETMFQGNDTVIECLFLDDLDKMSRDAVNLASDSNAAHALRGLVTMATQYRDQLNAQAA